MGKTFVAATRNVLSLYVTDEVAKHLPGGVRARAFIEQDHLVLCFTSGHPTGKARNAGFMLSEYKPSGTPEGKWGSLRYVKVEGWGRGMPQFGKTEAETTTMREVDGVPTLVVRMPVTSRLRPLKNVSRPRPRSRSAPAAPPPSNGSSLRCLVSQINDLKREIGDDLVFSVASDGTLRATVEYS